MFLLHQCNKKVLVVLVDFLSQELKDSLEQKGYHLWTPLRQNMVGAEQHNHWQLLVMRRTIETRFSELYSLFNIEHTFLRYFEIN